MTKPTGIDEAWGRADWATLQRNGVLVASLYLSNDPSKNAKPADILAAHKHGIGILLNWEAMAGAPLNGAGQGSTDARSWVQQRDALIKAVGYAPKNRLGAIFSCDRDVTSSQYPRIDAYYAATKKIVNAARAANGVYGKDDLIDHLHAKGLTEVEWQTYAWSGGRLSPEADFYQYLNGQTFGGASVDFDRVVHAAQIGAWWPPGHKYDTAGTTGGMTMLDPEVKAAFDALNKKVDAIPHGVWSQKLTHGATTTYAGTWLIYSNLRATAALAAANAATAAAGKIKGVAIDAAAVAAEIKDHLITSLGGKS